MVVFKKILPCLIFVVACESAEYADDQSILTGQKLEKEDEIDGGKVYRSRKNKQSFTAAVILDGTALTQTWQRFFAVDGELLSAKQQRNLGGLNYDAEDSALFNGRRYREINQSYVKTLREVLLQLCRNKVEQEVLALTTTNSGETFAQHALVKRSGAPQATDVNAIMTKMFGYEAKHYGAQEYAAVMQENLAAVPIDSEIYQQKLQANYVLLCMAIGQDARVYLR